ncbi:tRNA lysidine(34) synthetase TilS [Paracoccus aurantiacus]|uniref:tRNA lysidine(34) synthetase TilS n=1 Tax=Paracoccus aurantiacus TaxID=2599412 RepID=UPI001FE4A6F3|nr:tRNA lysidine(34) synthetase TilS [Paracoccus aurantiacus]
MKALPTDPNRAELPARAFAAFDRLAADLSSLGIAFSGGSDSLALLHLGRDWAATRGVRLAVATVDHGLRPESGAEARGAADVARALGLDHEILHWRAGAEAAGNLMANARDARADLMADWAGRTGLDAVAIGHTSDDQAETLLMRLARGAGIDGLAAMSPRRLDRGTLWLRPLLDFGRQELRDWLRGIGAVWVDDPSNENERFERVRARRAIAALGLDPAALSLSARHLAAARDALDAALSPLIATAEARAGALLLDRTGFDSAPTEQRRRLILAALRFVNGPGYPPRRAGVEHALAELSRGVRVTLDGMVLDPGERLLFHREPAATATAHSGVEWDSRWYISGLQNADSVGALARDVSAFDWRSAGLTHLEAQSLPAVRRANRVFAPYLAPETGLAASPLRDIKDFHRILLGH